MQDDNVNIYIEYTYSLLNIQYIYIDINIWLYYISNIFSIEYTCTLIYTYDYIIHRIYILSIEYTHMTMCIHLIYMHLLNR